MEKIAPTLFFFKGKKRKKKLNTTHKHGRYNIISSTSDAVGIIQCHFAVVQDMGCGALQGPNS